ncbi:hypothetical protein B0J11DRAFT_308378 [Dendryphion nanum]|uniref:C3H1-type domain-containing protein n=1 Tax=Dendryphion nanum TaxID=256645 RepID=A0A9P9IKF2_9PLEO|nr:hypothetical protein B0J11DRAFT_308378 [Dendryphion nanum]
MAPPYHRSGHLRRWQHDRYRPYHLPDHDIKTAGPHVIYADKALPKNFAKPLTCFFWKHHGKCNKRDIDCAYAHWDTGHSATAPITLPSENGIESLAGRNAERQLSGTGHSVSIGTDRAESVQHNASIRSLEKEIRQKERDLRLREERFDKYVEEKENDLDIREECIARKEEALALGQSAEYEAP